MSARIPRAALLDSVPPDKLEQSPNTLYNIPYIDPTIVAYLKQVFIPKVTKGYDIRDYDRQVGNQEIIEFLAKTVKAQEEEEKSKYV